MLAELPADSLGAYVISMTKTASDVLAVVLLQVGGFDKAPTSSFVPRFLLTMPCRVSWACCRWLRCLAFRHLVTAYRVNVTID